MFCIQSQVSRGRGLQVGQSRNLKPVFEVRKTEKLTFEISCRVKKRKLIFFSKKKCVIAPKEVIFFRVEPKVSHREVLKVVNSKKKNKSLMYEQSGKLAFEIANLVKKWQIFFFFKKYVFTAQVVEFFYTMKKCTNESRLI